MMALIFRSGIPWEVPLKENQRCPGCSLATLREFSTIKTCTFEECGYIEIKEETNERTE